MQTKRRVLAALVATLLLLTAGAEAQEKMDIKIGAGVASDHAPAFAALERGIFAKHGLNAKLVIYPTGVEEINGMLAGAQEVSVMGTIPFLAGVSNGLPLILIGHLHSDATQDNYSTGHSIVVGAGTGIKDIKGLKGKKVGLPRGTGAEAFLIGHLQANGLNASDVSLINVKPADLATGLVNKDVDAIAIWEPWPSAAVVNIPGTVRIASGGCPTCYIPAALLTTKKIVAEKPELLRRFMAAFAEAEQWVRNNSDAAAEIDMRWVPGIELAVMKEAVKQANYDLRMSKYTDEMFKAKTIPSLVSAGNVKAAFDPAPNIDPQFYLAAESKYPQFFSDLKPIPAEKRLK
ncbi:MAG: ABC transporter substrate-binding protein [Proteobacteria bacterium]|nr:ABC transporter substrate-binding protein [Pseudomonadota bacterium]MBI3498068.1 ABC transporter substrate-binding protein [Pseudomonadota bacterium]